MIRSSKERSCDEELFSANAANAAEVTEAAAVFESDKKRGEGFKGLARTNFVDVVDDT